MHSIRKSLLSVILALLVFMAALTGISTTSPAVRAEEDYHLWSQMDPRWGNIPIGGSTIAKSGCLVTSIAILAVHSGEKDPETFNPGTFANSMSALGGFTSGGAIASWATITQVLPDVRVVDYTQFKSSDQAGKAAEIKARMDAGYYVIVNVNWHWVFVEGVVGNDVYMIDPAKDDVLLFDAYANSGILEYEVFTGKNPPPAFTAPGSAEEVTTTVTEETTTTTAPVTTEPVTTTTTVTAAPDDTYELGEYCYTGFEPLGVYVSDSEEAELMTELRSGNIVSVLQVSDGRGLTKINGAPVWIDITKLTYTGAEP
ncbi:MAG: hypothetical protein IJM44_07850, partial [Ruminococcus sp.]|nr:hypothetical protein [Ruminococcus sp.]